MEIERKWLLTEEKIPYDLNKLEHFEIEQAYISFSPTIRIRKIKEKNRFILTVKTNAGSPLMRNEYESYIKSDEYDSLLKKCEGNIITKTRYINIREDGLTEEIDIFRDKFEGLCYLEIEFRSLEECEKFVSPDWVTADVTKVSGFSNSELAKNGMPDITGFKEKIV